MSVVVPGLLPWHLDEMTTGELLAVIAAMAARVAATASGPPA